MATGTDFKAHLAVMAALIGVAAMLPLQWRVSAERAWSYGVYYVGYRLLSVQLILRLSGCQRAPAGGRSTPRQCSLACFALRVKLPESHREQDHQHDRLDGACADGYQPATGRVIPHRVFVTGRGPAQSR